LVEVEADAVIAAESNTETLKYLVWKLYRGLRTGHVQEGFPGNLGGPNISLKKIPAGGPVDQKPSAYGTDALKP
jgi:hypothetical protein